MSKEQCCQMYSPKIIGKTSQQPGPHTSSEFHLFESFKKQLEGRLLRNNIEVQQTVLLWLHDFESDFFYAGFDALVYRRNKCFDNHSDYVEY
ncbi:hypothetical protein AVEN_178952-1 [Araneus ventricosus]|uniref:Uncharacterized protein n=1 Tax=Araneus ventricosus TaxID=182803 RepID=A0A4Y2NS16_ARAVE|nr:hypothetical protein AVEN_178952-1 [Araneus ventricosus]